MVLTKLRPQEVGGSQCILTSGIYALSAWSHSPLFLEEQRVGVARLRLLIIL